MAAIFLCLCPLTNRYAYIFTIPCSRGGGRSPGSEVDSAWATCPVEVRPCPGQDGMLPGRSDWLGAARLSRTWSSWLSVCPYVLEPSGRERLARRRMVRNYTLPLLLAGCPALRLAPTPAYRSTGTRAWGLNWHRRQRPPPALSPCNHPMQKRRLRYGMDGTLGLGRHSEVALSVYCGVLGGGLPC